MKQWQVLLKGQPRDIGDLYKNQRSNSWSIVKYDGKYFLESIKFQCKDSTSEVKKIARDLLELINGSARLKISQFRPVEMEGTLLYQIDEKGLRKLGTATY